MISFIKTIGLSLALCVMTALTARAILDNTPPNPPDITGPTSGIIGTSYLYKVLVTDPDENDELLKLEMDFGDGVITETCGCSKLWVNGQTLNISHQWKKPGNYAITARVMDVNGAWSEWSEPLTVSLPRSQYFPLQLQELIRANTPWFPFLKMVFSFIVT